MSILVGIYHACFLRLERIVFYGDHHQTLYQCVFKSKRKYEKHLYYWEIFNLVAIYHACVLSLERIVFC